MDFVMSLALQTSLQISTFHTVIVTLLGEDVFQVFQIFDDLSLKKTIASFILLPA
jgi:hypothetical protein